MVKLPFKLLKCQAKGCKQKATQIYGNVSGWYCEDHHKANVKDVQKIMEWIVEQDEKYYRDPKAFYLR